MDKSLVFALACLTCLVSLAPAQNDIILANGRVLRGRVVSDDGEKIRVRLAWEGAGGVISTHRYTGLHPKTVFQLRLKKAGSGDVKAQLELCNYALDHGLIDEARHCYEVAKEVDEGQGNRFADQIEKILARAPGDVMKRARELISHGLEPEAERYLTLLLTNLPQCAEASAARKLLDGIAPEVEADLTERRREEGGDPKERARELAAPARACYDAGRAEHRAGVKAANPTPAIHHLTKALEEYDKARDILARLLAAEESPMTPQFEAWDRQVAQVMAATHLACARVEINQNRSLTKGLQQVERALGLDPLSGEARAMQDRITRRQNDIRQPRQGR